MGHQQDYGEDEAELFDSFSYAKHELSELSTNQNGMIQLFML